MTETTVVIPADNITPPRNYAIDYPFSKAFPYPHEKTAVFMDGANLYNTIRALGIYPDWIKLRELLISHCHLISLRYYTAITDERNDNPSITKMLDFLEYNNFVLVKKDAKIIHRDDGTTKIKGDMDLEIALDAVSVPDGIDHIILFTGDGDFCSLVKFLQNKGKRVTIFSSIATSPPMIADSLRRQADCFVEISTMKDQIRKQWDNAPE